jgi:hypothetical protein
MQVRIWPGVAAARGIERDGGACGHEGLRQVVMKLVDAVLHAFAPAARDRLLLGLAHDVHEGDPVFDANAIEHLAQVGGRRGVHQCLVAFAAHRLHHAERRQRVDEARRAIGRCGAGRQHQALLVLERPILRVHRAAQHGHRLAEQCLRSSRRASIHHHAGALIAHRQ